MLLSVSRGLDYCGNLFGAGREKVLSPSFGGSGTFYCMASVDVQRKYHFSAWTRDGEGARTPVTGDIYLALLLEVAKVADNSTYREAALGEYRELSWHVESIACHGRESYYAALQVSRDTKEAAKALGLDPCDHVDVSQHGSGYECSVWILTSPEFESLRN